MKDSLKRPSHCIPINCSCRWYSNSTHFDFFLKIKLVYFSVFFIILIYFQTKIHYKKHIISQFQTLPINIFLHAMFFCQPQFKTQRRSIHVKEPSQPNSLSC